LNTEALRLLGGQLLRIKIEVMDEDTFSDDLLLTNDTFQIGINDTDFIPVSLFPPRRSTILNRSTRVRQKSTAGWLDTEAIYKRIEHAPIRKT